MAWTDQEWVHALKQNEAQAEQELWGFLFAAANFKKYRTNDRVAEVARDAAVRAYERIKARALYQFRFECPFRGYCLRIFTNEFNRLIGKISDEGLVDNKSVDDLPGEDADIPSLAHPERIQQRLKDCLERLVGLEQDVLHCYYFDNLKPEAAAAKLAITRNHFGVLAHRARQKLRQCLESRGFHSASAVLSL